MSVKDRWNRYRLKRRVNKCVANGLTGVSALPGLETSVEPRYQETLNHFRYMIPSDSQGTLPSCAGYAVANYTEWLWNQDPNRSPIPRNKQVNGKAIWEKARQMYYGGDRSGGLYLPQAFLAAKEMGILRGTYKEIGSVREALAILPLRPLVVGVYITDDWYDCNHFNGYIPATKLTQYGHAVVLSGLTYQNQVPYAHLFNSWGTPWGADGVCTLSLDFFCQSIMSIMDMQASVGPDVGKYLI